MATATVLFTTLVFIDFLVSLIMESDDCLDFPGKYQNISKMINGNSPYVYASTFRSSNRFIS